MQRLELPSWPPAQCLWERTTDPQQVQQAHLEHSGDISVIPHKEVRLVDVAASQGVQTVRIEIKG